MPLKNMEKQIFHFRFLKNVQKMNLMKKKFSILISSIQLFQTVITLWIILKNKKLLFVSITKKFS